MARVLVGVKRAFDSKNGEENVGATAFGAKYSINPFDEMAVEEAVQLKENKIVTEVIAVSYGPSQSQDTLRTAMAMGADRAIHVEISESEFEALQPIHISKILAKVAKNEKADLIIIGKQESDQTDEMTAAALNWPQEKLNLTAVVNTDEIQGKLPAVITVNSPLNESRYATLPNIMKAKKKPIKMVTPEDIGVEMIDEPKYATLPNIMKAKKKPIQMLTTNDLGVEISTANVEPTYATLPNIMKAKKKPIQTVTANDLGVDISTANVENIEPTYATLPNIMKAKKKPIKTVTPTDLGVDLLTTEDDNEPKYATLPNIMKAMKKPIKTVTPNDLGVDISDVANDEEDEPKYATLPNIMKAKKKPIKTVTPNDLGVDLTLLTEEDDCSQCEASYATLPNIMKAKKKPIKKVTLSDLGVGVHDIFLPHLNSVQKQIEVV